MAGQTERTIGGNQILFGGTRTGVVEGKAKSRIWQTQLTWPDKEKNEKCGLCIKDDASKYIPRPGWKSFQNAATPYEQHRILIPDTCWDNETLRSLGGSETLKVSAHCAFQEAQRAFVPMFPLFIYTHIGYGAGQNFPHHHWHITSAGGKEEPRSILPELTKEAKAGKNVLFQSDHFSALVTGVRAGDTFIIPRFTPSEMWHNLELFFEFAEMAHRVVEVFNRKFFDPDYCLLFGFHSVKEWYGLYSPTLNNWGGDQRIAPYVGTAYCLPWPHEETVKYLLS